MSSSANITSVLAAYQQEMRQELAAILQYWQQHTIDNINGGFWGKVTNDNIPDITAAKGVVLHARILWTFSAAYCFTKKKDDLLIADRAFNYMLTYFKDEEYSGVYWSVDKSGKMLNDRKQMYGLAFAVYGLSEYYCATQNTKALSLAIELYNTIEKHSFDSVDNGYFEAFARDWKPLSDLRLSAKDANDSKTMNTHLHIIESYANLYKVWQDDTLKKRIENLLYLFDNHFINKQTNHLILFFDDHWNEQPGVISYGHDIEAAWLLLRCADVIQNQEWIAVYKQHATAIADAASEGLDADGGLWYEFEPHHQKLIAQKHWWPQAEAMIGYLNAYEVTKKESYAEKSLRAWHFIQEYLLDKQNGEWFWGVDEAHHIMPGEDKAGFWKCPYHNARACMEVITRVNAISQTKRIDN